MTGTTLLHMAGITKTYFVGEEDLTVLHSINLDIGAGE